MAGLELVFWLHTFVYIYKHTNWRGDGMEWVAVMPLSCIALGLAGPGLYNAFRDRFIWFAAAMVGAAFVADYFLWSAIVAEL